MSQKRMYVVGFDNVTVSAAQDLIMVKASATNGLVLRRASISAQSVASPTTLRVRLKRMTATVTNGSGGGSGSIKKVSDRNSITVLSSARINDTTQATTNGTTDQLATWNWDMLQDFLETPPDIDERWECDVSEALVLDLLAAPGASVALSGFVVFEET